MVLFPLVDCQAMGIDTRVKSRFSESSYVCARTRVCCLLSFTQKLAHACYEVMGDDNDNYYKKRDGI